MNLSARQFNQTKLCQLIVDIIIALEQFNRINITFGHGLRDALLKAVAG
ncbi:MAG: hypothetical protein F6K10_41135 [Moorea sp. SIO2B7]|nr:hypothetical protein [Moorena sp. SIO2B7]